MSDASLLTCFALSDSLCTQTHDSSLTCPQNPRTLIFQLISGTRPLLALLQFPETTYMGMSHPFLLRLSQFSRPSPPHPVPPSLSVQEPQGGMMKPELIETCPHTGCNPWVPQRLQAHHRSPFNPLFIPSYSTPLIPPLNPL